MTHTAIGGAILGPAANLERSCIFLHSVHVRVSVCPPVVCLGFEGCNLFCHSIAKRSNDKAKHRKQTPLQADKGERCLRSQPQRCFPDRGLLRPAALQLNALAHWFDRSSLCLPLGCSILSLSVLLFVRRHLMLSTRRRKADLQAEIKIA